MTKSKASSKPPRVSVFVSTYEMPRHLELVCAALERQSEEDFEVLFCDDGSGEDTRRVVEEFKALSGVRARHFRQDHQGFRKSRILNQAAREAKGKVYVFLDGDCIPHRHFIRDHLALQEPGRYLAGRRVELGRELSESLTPSQIKRGFFDRPNAKLILSALKGETDFLNRSLRIPFAPVRSALGMDRVADLKGCNYSIPREALEAINGFDEEYEGYGREDTDVELRLQNLGYRIKSLKGVALQFHVWHPRREFTPRNDARLEEVKRSRLVQCNKGLTDLSDREKA